jgi:hypothetical protein
MGYATTDDVLARAGRVGGTFTVAGRRPNLEDVAQLVDDVAAEIDVEIRARGFDPAALDDATAAALRDINAYGALARALAGVDPSDRPDNLDALIKRAEKVWSSDPGSDKRGDALAQVLAVLAAGAGGEAVAVSAGSLWDDEPDYGTPLQQRQETLELGYTNLGPGFRRGMTF